MKDVQGERDTRNIPIDRVGVCGVSYPLVVMDPHENVQHVTASVTMSVSLPKDFRGTHMSRFIEVLESCRGNMTLGNLEEIVEALKTQLDAPEAEITVSFPYFIRRAAPVSGAESYSRTDVEFWAVKAERFDFILKVGVPVQTLCPCSKEISEYGAHNQRARVEIEIRMKRLVWIEELVAVAEESASAPVLTLLKREDEKALTELAFSNPRFVEDVVREISMKLDLDGRIKWYRVSVVSDESIHNHQAFASLERTVRHSADRDLGERCGR
ncbi:MAG: GTP cyclohydrolase FolE2 [Synergistales bacterium]